MARDRYVRLGADGREVERGGAERVGGQVRFRVYAQMEEFRVGRWELAGEAMVEDGPVTAAELRNLEAREELGPRKQLRAAANQILARIAARNPELVDLLVDAEVIPYRRARAAGWLPPWERTA